MPTTTHRPIHFPERSRSHENTETGDCEVHRPNGGSFSTAADEGHEGTQFGEEAMRALLCGEKLASDTGAIYTSFAVRTRDISNARANATAKTRYNTDTKQITTTISNSARPVYSFRELCYTTTDLHAEAETTGLVHIKTIDEAFGHRTLGSYLHAANIPLHALPLSLARGQEIAYVVDVSDATMALELGARKAACLGSGRRIADMSCAAQDGAIEGQDACTLEELQRDENEFP
ncbi:hypothetical protein FHL15_007679 [Xylaria flabelliformis]|uniref:Uncharacterized protein n=1 Tax=Xylaria flabelliformis TaxID=2512241 RepID=A0A553HU27_9PEZI|nr:hypothetical protein FHL15_007679 [Xylaria flabelliformis]